MSRSTVTVKEMNIEIVVLAVIAVAIGFHLILLWSGNHLRAMKAVNICLDIALAAAVFAVRFFGLDPVPAGVFPEELLSLGAGYLIYSLALAVVMILHFAPECCACQRDGFFLFGLAWVDVCDNRHLAVGTSVILCVVLSWADAFFGKALSPLFLYLAPLCLLIYSAVTFRAMKDADCGVSV